MERFIVQKSVVLFEGSIFTTFHIVKQKQKQKRYE